jgi:hypothetical protein
MQGASLFSFKAQLVWQCLVGKTDTNNVQQIDVIQLAAYRDIVIRATVVPRIGNKGVRDIATGAILALTVLSRAVVP